MNRHTHPEIYHKHILKSKYFEGWYFKQVSADSKHTIIFIPGVSFDSKGSHSFIQCLYYNQEIGIEAFNVDYDIQEFKTKDSPFEVHIKANRFSYDGLHLDINNKNLVIKGDVNFFDITPIKTSLLSPNIMGFFSYIPYMECNHGILSMNHSLSGSMEINGINVDFTGGKGYIEKDWGRSFPSKYIWVHSNHFNNPSVSLFCSIARIPFGVFSFTGLICNFIHNDREYRFATYNGSKIKIKEMSDHSFEIRLKNRKHTLYMKGSTELSKELLAPKLGAMNTTIKEGLSGKVQIVLKKNTGEVVYKGTSHQCGIELEY